MAARSAAFRKFGSETSWCVCNPARIRKLRPQAQRLSEQVDGAESNARVLVLPKRREEGVLGSNKSSRQVCEKENTLIERGPARNARWCFFFPIT
jgi:hypothetical protein